MSFSPLRELTTLPKSFSWIWGPTSRREKEREKEMKGKKRKRKKETEDNTKINVWLRPCIDILSGHWRRGYIWDNTKINVWLRPCIDILSRHWRRGYIWDNTKINVWLRPCIDILSRHWRRGYIWDNTTRWTRCELCTTTCESKTRIHTKIVANLMCILVVVPSRTRRLS